MKIQPRDFYNFFKQRPSNFLIKKIKKFQLNYQKIELKKKKIIIQSINEDIKNLKKTKLSSKYLEKWDSGWKENYLEFLKTKKVNSLVPKYFYKSNIIRINGEFYKSINKNFDSKLLNLINTHIFEKYFKNNNKPIVEFGCGTGSNLLLLRKINKKSLLLGLDWSQYSQKILNKFNNDNVFGYKFDYFNPYFDKKIKFEQNEWSCYTVASLEQVGKKYINFINFLKKNKPSIIVNIEPINELLNLKNINDNLSIRYAKKRGYLNGYYNYLLKLQKSKIIKILKVRKSYFGSKYINGYSLVVWKFI